MSPTIYDELLAELDLPAPHEPWPLPSFADVPSEVAE